MTSAGQTIEARRAFGREEAWCWKIKLAPVAHTNEARALVGGIT